MLTFTYPSIVLSLYMLHQNNYMSSLCEYLLMLAVYAGRNCFRCIAAQLYKHFTQVENISGVFQSNYISSSRSQKPFLVYCRAAIQAVTQVETIFGLLQHNYMSSLHRQKLSLVYCRATILSRQKLFWVYAEQLYGKRTQVGRLSKKWQKYYI